MTGQQLKELESRLWKAADDLRANSKLTATEYSFPVLGIIFLRHNQKSVVGQIHLSYQREPNRNLFGQL